MAELNMPQKGGKRKVAAPRIDLTPMVDLGFLLITFFMFTTTLAQNRSLVLDMPANEITGHPAVYPDEATITLLPINEHKVAYYEGALKDDQQLKKCSISQLRGILQKKQTEVAALPPSFSKAAHQIHVLIKPKNNSKYADLVSLLDEMLILKIDYYTIVDITADEEQLTAKN